MATAKKAMKKAVKKAVAKKAVKKAASAKNVGRGLTTSRQQSDESPFVKKAAPKAVEKKTAPAKTTEAVGEVQSAAQKRADAIREHLSKDTARRIGHAVVPVTFSTIEELEGIVSAIEGVIIIIRRPRNCVVKGAVYSPKTLAGTPRAIKPARDTAGVLERLGDYKIASDEVEIISGP